MYKFLGQHKWRFLSFSDLINCITWLFILARIAFLWIFGIWFSRWDFEMQWPWEEKFLNSQGIIDHRFSTPFGIRSAWKWCLSFCFDSVVVGKQREIRETQSLLLCVKWSLQFLQFSLWIVVGDNLWACLPWLMSHHNFAYEKKTRSRWSFMAKLLEKLFFQKSEAPCVNCS